MIAAVVKGGFNIHHRIAGQHAGLHRFFNAGLDRRDKLPRYRGAFDGLDELKALAARLRFELDIDHAVLAVAAALPDELAFRLYRQR